MLEVFVDNRIRLASSILAGKLNVREKEYKATITLDFAKFFNTLAVRTDSAILDVATGAGTIPELLGEHVVALDTATSNLAMINFASKNGFRFERHLKEFWGKRTGDAFY